MAQHRTGVVTSIGLLVGAATLLCLTSPASACRAPPRPPTAAEIENATPPEFGFRGKVVRSFISMSVAGSWISEEYILSGGYPQLARPTERIVEIDVVQDYSGQLPETVRVLIGACCRCWQIGTRGGDEVSTIVRLGRDGLLRTAKSDLFLDEYKLGSFLVDRFGPTCMESTYEPRVGFCSEFQREIQRTLAPTAVETEPL